MSTEEKSTAISLAENTTTPSTNGTKITFETMVTKPDGTVENEKYTYDLKVGDRSSEQGGKIVDLKTLKNEDNYPIFSYGYYAKWNGIGEDASQPTNPDTNRAGELFITKNQNYQVVNETDKAKISGTYTGTMY